MVGRDLDPVLNTALEQPAIRPIWILRMDIKDDPFQVWTGIGDLVVVGSGDTALDGFTFTGLGNIGEIGVIKDSDRGSDAVKLKLPGVDTSKDMLDPIITNPRVWQFRQAWLWFGLLDSANSIVINPFRVKTGRIDSMVLSDDGSTGSVETVIESHQAYISRALRTSYSEQKEIDPTDTSQDYIHDLANKKPGVGVKSSMGGGGGGGGEDGCVSNDMWVSEYLQAKDLKSGHSLTLLGEEDGVANKDYFEDGIMQSVSRSVQPCLEIETSGGAVLVCSESTPVTLRNGNMILVGECLGGELATLINGIFEWQKVVRIDKVSPRMVSHVHVEGRTFAAGKEKNSLIFTHNMAKARDKLGRF